MESLRNLSIPVCHIPGFCNLLLQNDYLHNRQATSEAHSTALYACNPAVISWCIEDIGTESLALSGVVFLCFLTCKSIYTKPTPTLSFLTCGLMFLLIMLRPFFICFVPVVLLSSALSWRGRRASVATNGLHSFAWRPLVPHSPLLLGHPTTIRTVHPLASFLRQPYHHGSSGRARRVQQMWGATEGYVEYLENIDRKIGQDKIGYLKGRCEIFSFLALPIIPMQDLGLPAP